MLTAGRPPEPLPSLNIDNADTQGRRCGNAAVRRDGDGAGSGHVARRAAPCAGHRPTHPASPSTL